MKKHRLKPNPIKALLKKYPGPWKVYPGLAWRYKVYASGSRHSPIILLLTDHLAIARAIARLGRKK